jgi:hypothetical protein
MAHRSIGAAADSTATLMAIAPVLESKRPTEKSLRT